MFRQPKGQHGYFVWKIKQLNAIELVKTNHAVYDHQHPILPLAKPLQFQNVHLQQTERFIRNDQKVATATGRVEKLHAAHPVQQRISLLHDGSALFGIFRYCDTP